MCFGRICLPKPLQSVSRAGAEAAAPCVSLRCGPLRGVHGLTTQSELLAGRPSIYFGIATDLVATLMMLSWVAWCVMGLSPRRSLHCLEVVRDAASAVAELGRRVASRCHCHPPTAQERRTGRLLDALRRRRRPQESTSPDEVAHQLGDAVVCAARSDCLRGRGYLRLHWFHLL